MTEVNRYFFCGIGGSGMLPLAYLLRDAGHIVEGSDRSRDQGRLPEKFADIERHGIKLFPQDGSGLTSPAQILVASAAIESSVPDAAAAERLGLRRVTRAEALAGLFNTAPARIAIGGTSGKSTTTGMTGWILHKLGRAPTIMNGAVMTNFATDDSPFASAVSGEEQVFVSEVDESDGSIALFDPTIAVLNNVSLDHKTLDELRALFGDFVAKADVAIVNADNEEAAALARSRAAAHCQTFSLVDDQADYAAFNLVPEPFGVSFQFRATQRGTTHRTKIAMPGRHNVANAMAAIAASCATGIDPFAAAGALESFEGIRRRMELIGTANGMTVFDDFGHNPDKIRASLSALHEFDGRLIVYFQPHGFGPLRLMKDELIACFAENLREGDQLLMPDPAYFGGTTDRSVTSKDLIEALGTLGTKAHHVASREEALAAIQRDAKPGDRIVVMGARDDTLSDFARTILTGLRQPNNS